MGLSRKGAKVRGFYIGYDFSRKGAKERGFYIGYDFYRKGAKAEGFFFYLIFILYYKSK